MWKQVGVVLAVSWMGLGSERAEARFGKRSDSESSPPSRPTTSRPHSSSGVGEPRPSPNPSPAPRPDYYRPRYRYYGGYPGYYGFYGYPWGRYYYDPAWAWPYLGPTYRYYDPYYGLTWRRPPMPPPRMQTRNEPETPTRVDFAADAGLVAQGTSMGLGLQVDGEQLGFGARLNVFSLKPDDGSLGRDYISLLSLKPSLLLVSREAVSLRLLAGMDVAFAPDAIFVGPGLGTSALVRVVGPLKLEASASWTPLPFTQLTGDAGVALQLGVVRLRGGYRATYLNDQGRVDGNVNRELFAGPYAGLSLVL
ncbi:hypothetical protein JRI60_16945 [Archangium violaceum]|uniref:hypothetical protein n=1 Tax=Archangium violaceum TaxID=83451 RepID=UPI0019515155|nr:hypothetical protein [Archangium violaceum]QRO00595.1 hypothetical protein JRI60_16945 [Archangium violaceum]